MQAIDRLFKLLEDQGILDQVTNIEVYKQLDICYKYHFQLDYIEYIGKYKELDKSKEYFLVNYNIYNQDEYNKAFDTNKQFGGTTLVILVK